MRDRHAAEFEEASRSAEQEARARQKEAERAQTDRVEKATREKRNRQAAEMSARPDLSEEQMAAVGGDGGTGGRGRGVGGGGVRMWAGVWDHTVTVGGLGHRAAVELIRK